ncbi:LacI family DNA-binding transcriptional regulator [Micromonospora sp. HUAS LYJ1]|uniref:LacI family DNA-binding transcriptional regulator n=1 Tax=Micromonospora sp. HUAS LYJ1 TaxID=3061626 RepID=UPI00267356AE|nr:LacI family DNA-binding transcriptional regulator [Micromonospora sp. HUAS LYJ1]WKU03351.1 LacI family DNA-binding transcriptional regulator [Micromonospora sp. HUAS LYJ1]
MSVSISDVAARAGVSRATVSHVLSGNRPVSQRVQSLVREAMQDLGYVPSRTAQNLARGTTRTIGLLVPDIGNSFFADLAKGVEQASIERGFNVLLGNTGWTSEREIFYLETLKSRAIDGVVYAAGAPAPTSRLAELFAGVPVVAVDEELDGLALTTVVSDNRAGGALAARHLAGLGHQRAVVVGANLQLASSKHRVDGFVHTWGELVGRTPEVIEGPFEEEAGYLAASHLVPRIRIGEVTAVFALNDMVALGALRALREAGLQIPTACSVVGFDDIYAARHVTPGLTTVRQDAVGMGALAASALLGVLAPTNGETRSSRHILPVSLTLRGTTGPLLHPTPVDGGDNDGGH